MSDLTDLRAPVDAAEAAPARAGRIALGADVLAPALLGLLFLVLMLGSWDRWTQPLVDHGREMNQPLRLLQGELLYRDVAHLYGPFPPYFHALLYRVLGPSLSVVHGAGAALALLLSWMSWRLARRILPPWSAALVTGMIVAACAFRPAGSWLQPYSYPALYAAAAGLGTVLLLLRWLEGGRTALLPLAGLVAGLGLASKLEFGVAACAAGMGGVLLGTLEGRSRPIRPALLFGLPAALVGGASYGVFLLWMPLETLVVENHVFFTHVPEPFVYFNRLISGVSGAPASLVSSFLSAAFLFAWGAVGVLLAHAVERIPFTAASRDVRRAAAILAAGAATWVFLRLATSWDLRANPVHGAAFFLPVVGLAALFRIRERGRAGDRAADRTLVLLSGLGMVSCLRFLLDTRIGSPYSPFYLVPTMLTLGYVTLVVIPSRLTAHPALRARTRNVLAICLGAFLLEIALDTVHISRRDRTVEVATARGRMLVERWWGEPYVQALDYVERHTSDGEPLLALPQLTSLNFLTGRPYPLEDDIVLPGILSGQREDEAIRRLEADPPRVVIVANLLTPEFGKPAFGVDYNERLFAWIEEHYVRDALFLQQETEARDHRQGDEEFFMAAYLRRDVAAARSTPPPAGAARPSPTTGASSTPPGAASPRPGRASARGGPAAGTPSPGA